MFKERLKSYKLTYNLKSNEIDKKLEISESYYSSLEKSDIDYILSSKKTNSKP